MRRLVFGLIYAGLLATQASAAFITLEADIHGGNQ
jgi:hypothetical protein